MAETDIQVEVEAEGPADITVTVTPHEPASEDVGSSQLTRDA